MAGLGIKVKAQFEELVRLKNEIDETKKALKEVNKEREPEKWEKLNSVLKDTHSQHEKLNGEMQVTIAKLEQTRKSTDDSSSSIGRLNKAVQEMGEYKQKLSQSVQSIQDLSNKIIEQKNIVKDIEADVNNLAEAYKKARFGSNGKELEQNLKAAKNALKEEKAALSDLRTELEKSKVANKGLIQEYKEKASAVKIAIADNKKLLGSLEAIPGPIGKVTSSIRLMTRAAMAFLATPLGWALAALVGGLMAVTTWFRRTEQGQNALNVASAGFKQTLDSILDVADDVGEWLYKAFTKPKEAIKDLGDYIESQVINRFKAYQNLNLGKVVLKGMRSDFSGLWNDIAQFVTGVEDAGDKLKEFVDEATDKKFKAELLADRENALNTKNRELLVDRSKLEAKINELREKGLNMDISEKDRIDALKEASKLNDGLYQKEIELAKEKFKIIKESNALLEDAPLEKRDAQAQAEAELNRLKAERSMRQKRLTHQMNSIKRRDNSAAEKARREEQLIADATLELQRSSKARELAVKSAELEISQARINQMEEGFAKEHEQIKLNHEKELLSIRQRAKDLIEARQDEERKEWVKSGGKGIFSPTTSLVEHLPEIDQSELNSRLDSAWQVFESSQAKNLKALLDQYRTYEQQRADINRKFNEDAQIIKDQNLSDEKDRLSVLERQRKEAIKSINETEAAETEKSSELFLKLFSDASRMSNKRIKDVISETKKLVNYLSGVSLEIPLGFSEAQLEAMKSEPEKIRAIYDALIQKQDELDNRTNYPFSGIVKGFKNWAEAAKNTAKANREANEETKRYLLNEADAQRAKGLEFIKEGAVEAANGLSTLADLMKELAEASGDTRFSEFAEQMGALGENISAAAQGFQQGGWVGAIISGAQNMLKQTIESFATAKAEQKEFEQNRLDFLDAYNLKLLEVNDKDFDSIFGSNGLEKAREASVNAQKALDQYYDIIQKTTSPKTQKEFKSLGAAIFGGMHFGSWLGLTKSVSNETKTLMAAYKKGYTDIQAMAVKTKDRSGWSNFWGRKDKYTSLKDLAPELWDDKGEFNTENAKIFLDTNTQINDEQRKQIQNVIDLKDSYEENLQIIRDDLQDTFGGLGSGIMDSIVNAIQTGADKWKIFREAGVEALETLGEKLAHELYFSRKFAKLQEEMEKTYDLETSEATANKQMELMADFFNTIGTDMDNAQKWMEQWQAKAKEKGFDLWADDKESSSGNSLKGAYSKASQESIDLLAGQTGAVRVILENMYRLMLQASENSEVNVAAIIQDALTAARQVNENGWEYVKQINGHAASIAQTNAQIAENTASINEISGRMEELSRQMAGGIKKSSEGIDTLVNHGVKIKGGL